MVRWIRLYVEGGGDGQKARAQFRIGFAEFLDSLRTLARSKNIRWEIIPCGARQSAYADFEAGLRRFPDAFNVLIVDSESPVTSLPWQHLKHQDNWDSLGTGDDHCHLMAQAMEAWFMADKNAVSEYFGTGFQEGALPQNPNVEQISKDDLKRKLNHACRNTKKKQYKEIRDGSQLLQRINPPTVREAAPHCERLFDTLKTKMT